MRAIRQVTIDASQVKHHTISTCITELGSAFFGPTDGSGDVQVFGTPDELEAFGWRLVAAAAERRNLVPSVADVEEVPV